MSDEPSRAEIRRWRRYLAAERVEAAVYRDLASRRDGEERAILLALAEAEGRHEQHWLRLLGEHAGALPRGDVPTGILGFLARRFGSVFVLALAQRAESRSPYESDADATVAMAADERVHEEVVRALAARGRQRLSGSFRAAVFGANDGLVSNLALVMGVAAAGLSPQVVLLTGLAGTLAGALSMGAGEYVSVRSQRELLNATLPSVYARGTLPDLDVNANELALVYRARGMTAQEAEAYARAVLTGRTGGKNNARVPPAVPDAAADEHVAVGSATAAAASSFVFFGSGAIVAVLPYLFGMTGMEAVIVAAVLVGLALLATGSIVGLLSGASPVTRGLRQLAIGYAAAAATYLLGLAFGVSLAG